MKKSKKLKQDKRIVLYLLYILILMPDFLKSMWSVFGIISMGIRGIAGIVTILMLLKRKKRSKTLKNLSIYIGYLLIITLLRAFSTDNIIRFIAIYADIFIMSVFTDYLLENDTAKYIKIMNTVLWIGLLVNAASVFLLPNGIIQGTNEAGVYFPYYFYDYDNHFIIRYASSFAIIFMHEKYYKGRDKGGALIVIAMLIGLSTLIKLHSIASMVAMMFMLGAYVLMDFIPEKVIQIRTIWLSFLVTSLIIVLGFSFSFTFTTSMIASLGKTMSLFKRSTIWMIATRKIPENIVMGTGLINSTDMKSLFGFAQLHNSLLTTVLWGGVVGLVLYSRFIFSIQSTWKRSKDHTDSRFMIILFATMMIASLVDGIELLSNVYMLYFIIARSENVREALSSEQVKVVHRRRLRITARRLSPQLSI